MVGEKLMDRSPLKWIPLPRLARKKRPVALSPGSLIHLGQKRAESQEVTLIAYDESSVEIEKLRELPEKHHYSIPEKVTWFHVTGLHEVEKLSVLGEEFGISNLVLEDILSTGSRPKIEKRDTEIFVVSKLIVIEPGQNTVDVQHLAVLLLPDNVLVTFLEAPSPAFDPVIERIRSGSGGRIRRFGADYLAWALLDAMVDNYLYVIDRLDEAVASMDDRLQLDATDVDTGELYELKRDAGQLYRAIRPIREITGSLNRLDSPLLEERTRPFFTDLNDHGLQVLETTEDLRESVSALRDFYLAAVSNRMNEVMKVLTCFATIFLPLTFIAGIYGMNFEHMPELGVPWAYPAVWGVFALCAAGMLWFFRRKKWL
ncbi:MAG: magnesium/cobalt transporter CorA [Verrucomicrobiales bacterium]